MTTTLAIQERLIALGYKPGTADGIAGPVTLAALFPLVPTNPNSASIVDGDPQAAEDHPEDYGHHRPLHGDAGGAGGICRHNPLLAPRQRVEGYRMSRVSTARCALAGPKRRSEVAALVVTSKLAKYVRASFNCSA